MPSLPVPRSSFDLYLEEISRFPLLTREEEQKLARRMLEKNDVRAAQRLVTANLRFVVKIAYEYRHYEVKLADLIQEGNIGLMKAVSKFNPDRGYRLISYAVWWIKAYMQNFIIKNWSMVKLRSGGRHRSLFFRADPDRDPESGRLLPEKSASSEDAPRSGRDVRAALRDFSLDAMMDDDGKRSFLDMIPADDARADEVLARAEEHEIVTESIGLIKDALNPKERYILGHRVLSDDPETLQQIGERFGISRERVRQIEQALKKKIKRSLTQHAAFAHRK